MHRDKLHTVLYMCAGVAALIVAALFIFHLKSGGPSLFSTSNTQVSNSTSTPERVLAQPSEFGYTGQIVAHDPSSVTVRTAAYGDVRFTLTDKTPIMKGKTTLTQSALTAGTSVTVRSKPAVGGNAVAISIKLI